MLKTFSVLFVLCIAQGIYAADTAGCEANFGQEAASDGKS